MVLVATGGVSHEVHPVLRLLSAPNADLALPLLSVPGAERAWNAAFRVLQRMNTDIGHDADRLSRALSNLPNARSRRAFVRTLRGAIDWRGQAITMMDRCYLARDLPMLVVWGERDAVIPMEHAGRLHAALPNSHLDIFAGAGHFPHEEQPERFVDLVRSFCQHTAPCTHSADEWRALLRRGAQYPMLVHPPRASLPAS